MINKMNNPLTILNDNYCNENIILCYKDPFY